MVGDLVVLTAVSAVFAAVLWWAVRALVRNDERLQQADGALVRRPLDLPWEVDSPTVSLAPPPARPQVAGFSYDPDTAVLALPSDRQATGVIRRPPRGVASQLRLGGAETQPLPVVRDWR